MTVKELGKVFRAYEDEFLEFGRIEKKRSQRADLHAFLLLDSLFPGTADMVCSAEHDEIWLAPTAEELSEVASVEQVVELIRCGVRLDCDSLAMFV